MVQSVMAIAAESEPSKVPFYLAGGTLVAWAVTLSALGLARPDFPNGVAQYRATTAVSLLLVVACLAAVLLTN